MDDNIRLLTLPDYRGDMIQPGDKVQLRGGHPHSGRIGTYVGVERLQVNGKWGSLVRFDDEIGGDGCFVFKSDQWKRVQP